ncbi:MAG: 4Fe-4S binding protein [Ignavibacteria bacterium]|nr:4Fe-4S binding protein [Ignavibacteria bacterium]
MLRKIIQIEEDKCDGCGACVPECQEGALQIIDGKARLISDLFCDGLGACLGHCPTGALTIVEREAEPYDERKVMDYIAKGGPNVIKAHLKHLRDHKEFEFLTQAIDFLNDHGIAIPVLEELVEEKHSSCGCSGSQEQTFENADSEEEGQRQSHLTQWPIQMHLVSPTAAYYRNSDLLLAADCCAFSYGDFHKDFMKGKSVAIACPKLDTNKQVYLDKLIAMINDANIKSITVVIMQVPCCSGLAQLAKQAVEQANREVPIKVIVIGVQGEILQSVEL